MAAISASDLTSIAAFWRSAGPQAWFLSDPVFDAEIAIRFGDWVPAAVTALQAGPHPGEDDAEAALGLCILMDQFPRNIYRGLALSWKHDPLALAAARRIVGANRDLEIEGPVRQFFYTPFMHAEDAETQAESVMLYAERLGDENNSRHARAHLNIIEKFGRFPTRNAVLGRALTGAERRWLAEEGYGAELNAA